MQRLHLGPSVHSASLTHSALLLDRALPWARRIVAQPPFGLTTSVRTCRPICNCAPRPPRIDKP